MGKKFYKAYGLDLPLIDVPHVAVHKSRAPTAADKDFARGDAWIHDITADTRTLYVYGGLDSNGAALWILAGPGSSDVDQLTGDGGGAVSPSGGIITLEGGTNITTAGTPASNKITFNLDAAITLGTSVTSPIYTASGGMAINAANGQNIVVKLGDDAGANKVSFTNKSGVEKFAIDSTGVISLIGLTVSGAFVQTGGSFNVGQDNAANAINIGGGTTARAIGIANSAAAHTLTIGNASCGAFTIDTGAGISIDTATASNFTVTGASEDLNLGSVGGSVGISASEAVGDAIVIEASNAAGGVQLKAGTGGIVIGNEVDTTTLSLGDIAPTASRTITIGGGTVVTAAVTDTIDIAPDGATTNANSIKTLNLNTGGVTLGEVLTNIATGTITSGTHTVAIQTGNRAAGTVSLNLSTGTGTKTVNIGNADANTTVNIDAITKINDSVNANTSINTGTSTGTITIGNGSAGAITLNTSTDMTLDAGGVLELNTDNGIIGIGNDANAFPINIGTGAAARTITIGNTTGASQIDVNCGTGGVNIGTSANAHTTTIGSTNTTSGLVLQAGSGEITVTGTVKQIDAELIGQSGVYIPSFTMDSVASLAANTGGAPNGATGTLNNLLLQGGSIIQSFVVGAGQTILQPIMSANGLIINGDKTNTEGYEYNYPYLQYTIGTSAAFFFEIGLYINDMDGAAPYVFGFRKAEANNAVWSNYTDYATIGMVAASSVTNIITATELNSAGQTITDTTDAWGGDGSTNTLKVLVDGSGNVTYKINGASPSSSAAFQFDNADVVIPFIRIVHSASPTDVALTSLRMGFQA